MKSIWRRIIGHIFHRTPHQRPRPLPSSGTALLLCKAGDFSEPALTDWQVLRAANLAEAQSLLAREEIPVVLCERDASGVDWKHAVRMLAAAPCRPSVVLLAPPGGQPGWEEVAAVGGYDVITEPVNANSLMQARLTGVTGARSSPRRDRFYAMIPLRTA